MKETVIQSLKSKNLLIFNQRRILSLDAIQGNNLDESFKWSKVFNKIFFLCFSETRQFLYRKTNNHVLFTIPFRMQENLFKTLFSLFKAYFYLVFYSVKLIKTHDIHLLRPENTVLIGLPALIIGKFTKRPTVNWYIGHERNAFKAKYKNNPFSKLLDKVILIIEKVVLNSVAYVITLSDELFKIAQNHGVKNVIFSPNSLDTSQFPQRHYSHLYKPNPRFKLLFSGRLDPEKNIDIIIKAIEIVSKEMQNLEIQIAGDGVMMDWIKEYSKQHDLEGFVRILGYVDYSLMPQLYNEADIFLLPSQQIEGMSAALMEAMCSGCACIVTPVGQHAELIFHDTTGLLVKQGSAQELANSIKFLMKNPEKIKLYGKNARKLIIKRSKHYYSIHSYIYSKIINLHLKNK